MRRGMRQGPSSSRLRPHDGGRPSRDPATSSEGEGTGEALRGQSDHGSEVAQAPDHGRGQDGAREGWGQGRFVRPSLHRCRQRHGISRLPGVGGDKPAKQRFATCPIGLKAPLSVHIDPAEVGTEEGKLRLFVAIDRTSKVAFACLVESAGKMAAAPFLRDLIEAVPYPAKRRFAATPGSPTTARPGPDPGASGSPVASRTSGTASTSSTACATSRASSTA